MASTNPTTPRIVGALAIAVVAGVSGYLFITSRQPSTTTSTTTTPTEQVTTPPATSTNTTSNGAAQPSGSIYKDGSYTKKVSYNVPEGGANSLTITLSISAGTISAVTSSSTIADRESQRYVDSFASNIKSKVVGKAIDKAYVGRVGRASLTSSAFNDALDKIIVDAKA